VIRTDKLCSNFDQICTAFSNVYNLVIMLVIKYPTGSRRLLFLSDVRYLLINIFLLLSFFLSFFIIRTSCSFTSIYFITQQINDFHKLFFLLQLTLTNTFSLVVCHYRYFVGVLLSNSLLL
jgi:hypothetical protein